MFLYYAFESTWIPRILPFEAAIARMQFGVVNKATAKWNTGMSETVSRNTGGNHQPYKESGGKGKVVGSN